MLMLIRETQKCCCNHPKIGMELFYHRSIWMEWQTVKTVIDCSSSDLGLHCFHMPFCPKTWEYNGSSLHVRWAIHNNTALYYTLKWGICISHPKYIVTPILCTIVCTMWMLLIGFCDWVGWVLSYLAMHMWILVFSWWCSFYMYLSCYCWEFLTHFKIQGQQNFKWNKRMDSCFLFKVLFYKCRLVGPFSSYDGNLLRKEVTENLKTKCKVITYNHDKIHMTEQET